MILLVEKFIEDFKKLAVKIEVKGTPPSTQHLYGRGRNGRVYMKEGATKYKRDVGYEAKVVRKFGTPPSSNHFVVGIIYYFPDKKVRDLDNYKKLIYDGMSKIVWEDDKQLEFAFSRKFIDKENPRIEVYYIEC